MTLVILQDLSIILNLFILHVSYQKTWTLKFTFIVDNIRKKINSNYKNILDEMQLRLARETLSKCIGDVDEIRKKISPASGTRRQRMNDFLQFILQHKKNLIELEKTLKHNGLKSVIGKLFSHLQIKYV